MSPQGREAGAAALELELGRVSRELLRLSASDVSRMEFLGRVSEVLLGFARADAVDVCLREHDRYFCVGASHKASPEPEEAAEGGEGISVALACCGDDASCPALLGGGLACARGALATPETRVLESGGAAHPAVEGVHFGREAATSVVLCPFSVDAKSTGLIVLRSRRAGFFPPDRTELYGSLAELLGVAVSHQSAQRAVRARANELSVLYRIARMVSYPDASLDEVLARIVQVLPAGCSAPGRVTARIVVDGKEYRCSERPAGARPIRRDIVLRKRKRGLLELALDETTLALADEEAAASAKRLLGGLSGQLATLLCRLETRAEKENAQRLLRHADRLATIGTMASGLGHELNEPLTAVLGFAELAQKSPELPAPVRADLERIVSGSRHAHEIVRRLLLLGRQSAPTFQRLSLNEVVEDGLAFVERRCATNNVRVVHALDASLPVIVADRTQVCQVVVNLVRNAIQAMPKGGELRVETAAEPDGIVIAVEDTGVGMAEDVRARIFEPFFTTKGHDSGTGLGLAVVHDIVSLHGGSIEVRSVRGFGTRMTVRLPLSPPCLPHARQEGCCAAE